MAWMLYSLLLFTFVFITIAFIFRDRWVQYIPEPIREARNPLPGVLPDLSYYNPFRSNSWYYSALPTSSTFHEDAEAGFNSANFNLAENIGEGDSRGGLDAAGKREVQRIMKRKNVGFDEARRMWMQERFRKGGINEDGIPRDPKFVSFS